MQHRVGVLREAAIAERRVALPPGLVGKVRALGLAVAVERGAGERAWCPDSAYREAGAAVLTAEELTAGCATLLCVGPPDVRRLRPGTLLIGLLDPLRNTDLVAACAAGGVTAVSLDLLPRTLSRAQSMDALTSQAAIAGYKAAVLAADTYGGYFPMLVTAAGTVRPATVLVLGTGVAGLAAIGTARRIGAVVTGYDIRPEAAEEVRSLGAEFLDLGAAPHGGGAGGYARALSGGERTAQQAALQERAAGFDVVITTARVPGRTPPVLVTAEAVKDMRPGSVVIDLACGADGGNVEGSVPDTTVVTGEGVTVVGAGNLPSAMAPAASAAYGRNIVSVLAHLVRDGTPVIDRTDEILAAVVVGGATVREATA
jgi:NAD(P) transhydrogenase subunit alpha